MAAVSAATIVRNDLFMKPRPVERFQNRSCPSASRIEFGHPGELAGIGGLVLGQQV
jgi:hypothetical protein